MALNFKSPEVDRLARELASCTGENLTEAVRRAIEERLTRERRRDKGDKIDVAGRLMEIGRRCAALPILDDRTADEILGYDDRGLPS